MPLWLNINIYIYILYEKYKHFEFDKKWDYLKWILISINTFVVFKLTWIKRLNFFNSADKVLEKIIKKMHVKLKTISTSTSMSIPNIYFIYIWTLLYRYKCVNNFLNILFD